MPHSCQRPTLTSTISQSAASKGKSLSWTQSCQPIEVTTGDDNNHELVAFCSCMSSFKAPSNEFYGQGCKTNAPGIITRMSLFTFNWMKSAISQVRQSLPPLDRNIGWTKTPSSPSKSKKTGLPCLTVLPSFAILAVQFGEVLGSTGFLLT